MAKSNSQPESETTEAGVKVTRRKLGDYRPDARNPNQGSPRGKRLIIDSLREVGAGRSVVADTHGELVAGNQTFDAAAAAGITEVIEIETAGDALVVVRRTDLDLSDPDDPRARRYAYLDNRAQETSLTWDVDRMLADLEAGVDLDGIFRQDELDDLMAQHDIDELVESELAEDGRADRITGDKLKQVKPVLYVNDIATVERALRATGLTNRGNALVLICKAFLEGQADDTETN